MLAGLWLASPAFAQQTAPGLYPANGQPVQPGQGGPPAEPDPQGQFQIQNPAQVDPNQAAAGQLPANGIQPVDNEAIMNGLAAASQSGNGDDARHALFKAALNSVFPFSPSEIQELFDKMHQNQSAIAGPSIGNPKAETKAETIPLEPGAQPREIDTEVGFVTTVSFVDSTGNPWPIQDVGIGGNFDVPAPDQGGNTLRMTPLARYALGNMSVRLVGLTPPLSFKLRASTGVVDYRYDARVPRFGPKASASLIDHGNDLVAGDGLLMSVLDGAVPLSATRLTVVGTDSRSAAWRIGGKVYLRTPLMLLSPGWEGSVGSSDGTHVYLIADTPVLLLSDNGNLIHARIGNNAKPDEQPVPAIEDGLAHPVRASESEIEDAQPLITRRPGPIGGSGTSDNSGASGSSRTLIRPVQVGGAASQEGASSQAGSGTNNDGGQQ